jgi:iron complex transport system ATP-binding protein
MQIDDNEESVFQADEMNFNGNEESVLQADGVNFSYNGQMILEQVNLKISRGESIGILGENGCGKTTLLKLLAGLLVPNDGTIKLFDKDIASYKRMEIAKMISMVGQGIEPIFDFTVEETVLMGRNPHVSLFGQETKEDKAKTVEAMVLMGILDIRAESMTQLSTGELQRVFIARALVQETPILLLDEPTTALDVRHVLELVKLLKELQAQSQVTIVTVSCDINLITHLSEQVILIGDGNILANGPVNDIINPGRLYRTYGVRMIVAKGEKGISVEMPWDEIVEETSNEGEE